MDERPPCVVCGAPGGDCGPGHDPGRIIFSEWAATPMKPPPNPIGPDRPVVVQDYVYERVVIPGSSVETNLLRYVPGDRITIEEAERLGVPVVPPAQAAQPEVETQDVKPPKRKRR